MKIIRYIIILLMFGSQLLWSQSPITLTKLSKDSILIGETVDVTISLHQSLNIEDADLVFDLGNIENLAYEQDTNVFEKKADIEILNDSGISNFIKNNRINIPLSELDKNPLPWQATLTIGVYSIGAFNFPMPYIIRASGDTLAANIGNFLIVQPPVGFGQDSTKVINEIKPIIEIPTTWQDYLPWVYGILGLLLLGLFVLWFSKRKKKPTIEIEQPTEPVIIEPAHIIALRDLKRLENESIWEKGEIKQYQSELTRIIRQYLEGRYGINALEMTSGEISNAIANEPSMKGQSQALTNILTVADLVKFAKAQPSDDIHRDFLNTAIQFVNQTKMEGNVE